MASGNRHIGWARRKARLAIRLRQAWLIHLMFQSRDPVQALAMSIEFNITWACCYRGRHYSVGNNRFFCTNCNDEGAFGWSYYSRWLRHPASSTAGGKRYPPDRKSDPRGHETVMMTLACMEALVAKDGNRLVELLSDGSRVAVKLMLARDGRLIRNGVVDGGAVRAALDRMSGRERDRFRYDYWNLSESLPAD